ncbi:MAG TPA: hypothetical protein DCZ95_19460 [Verrucomicrobia bacterium]|nr:MAG: hypothetical protein A2X46_09010 [Lentisphaerae bacterium GWF2_57_35]HBA86266.1 hypothetical protein [Verrucomicrobiota bacterium]
MSLIQHAFIQKSRVPSREQWQQAIDKLGHEFELDPDLKPNEDSGFLPCKLKGYPSGFEIYYEPANEYLKLYPDLSTRNGNRDWCITFRWGGDLAECACVLIASAALIDSFDAIIYYPGDNMFYDKAAILSEIEACMTESH